MNYLLNFNEVEVNFPTDEKGTIYVPVKPICEVLGINHDTQLNSMKSHPILGSVTALRAATGADGKEYQMVCLPLKYALAWLLGIDSRNVKPEAQEAVMKYQVLCYDTIYDKFFLEPERQKEKLILILQKENQIATLEQQRKDLSLLISQEKKNLEEFKNSDVNQLKLDV
jgi:hypothetical protein